MTAVLTATGLRKSYNGRCVVDGINLSCEPSKILGLLGPNGAGKTTTLRMLYGFLNPDQGTILYHGRDFEKERTDIKRAIGVCTQEDSLDYDLNVEQNVLIYASYFRPKVNDLHARVQHLLKRFGLDQYAKFSPRQLSGGYIRRLLIARSIVHSPTILFLDEPTTGLDPSARLDVWELIDGMRREGMSIVLTTHYMDEAERLSDDLLVIDAGKELARGAPHAVIDRVLGDHVVVIPREEGQREAILNWLTQQGLGLGTNVLGELRVPIGKAPLEALAHQFPNARWKVREPTLDDLFIALARKQKVYV